MKLLFKLILNTLPRELLINASIKIAPLLSFFYRGKKYTDPINNKSYRTFLPYGYRKIRPNALSPGTLSLERHRLLWLYLQKETSFLISNLKVLHIAPEYIFYKKFKKFKHWEYITLDLYSPIAQIKADICKMPLEPEQFDFVLCNHVLEHIPDDIQAMKELFRVLKRGGTAILQVPIDMNRKNTYEDETIVDPKARSMAFGQYDHVRIYGLDYIARLQKVGFEARFVDYNRKLSAEEVNRFGLIKDDKIPLCIKPL